jgi:tetratricopeptide (TPR) repeat protein
MILAVLSAALLAQAAPATTSQDLPAPPAAVQEAAPIEQAPPAAEPEPAAPRATAPASAGAAAYIDAGLRAFRARRLPAARAAFENAVAADPQSAAAAFYLGYTLYKIGEPSHRMNANKERARELFAKAFSLDPQFQPAFRRK